MSGYRERRDPREVASEIVQEAYNRESQAMIAKSDAEVALQTAQADREAWWQHLGARSNLVRHLTAMQSSFAAVEGAALRAPRTAEPERAEAGLERIEAERASFLRQRGVEPGPALTEPRSSLDAIRLAVEVEHARGEVLLIENKIRAADDEVAEARVALERVLDALAEATRARVEAQAEAERLTG